MVHRTRYFVIASLLVLIVGLGTGLVAYYVGFQGGTSPERLSELGFIPSDAPLVAHADLHQVMSSDLRQRLRERFPDANGQHEFLTLTGINIERDVDGVTGVLSGNGSLQGRALPGFVLVRGRFDRAHIESLIREHGGRSEMSNGTTFFLPPESAGPSPSFALTFLEPDLVGVGSVTLLRAAVAQKQNGGAITDNADFMTRLRSVSSEGAWIVARADALASSGQIPRQVLADLPPLTWLAASLKVDAGLHTKLRVEAKDAQAANDLREMIKGIVAVGRLQRSSNPQIAAIAQGIAIGGAGPLVTLAFDLPSDLFANNAPRRTPEKPAQ